MRGVAKPGVSRWHPVSDNAYMQELLRPWKLSTLAIGLALLIYGSLVYQVSDWDIGVSVVMALSTYLTAPWVMRQLYERRWRNVPLCTFYCWLSVDGVYVAWHMMAGNEMLREAQWPTSLLLYLICGMIWLHKGPLRTIVSVR